jgi:Tat protein secretion system quality control protein TatD with DNase activity
MKRPVVFDILDEFFKSYEKVIFHCFSYDWQLLQRLTDKGGIASFSLNILRKNKDIIDSLAKCPLKNLLLETDSPYMKINGKPSSPFDIKLVYDFTASVKKILLKDLEGIVADNFNRVFRLK